jgi:hypothetical protein
LEGITKVHITLFLKDTVFQNIFLTTSGNATVTFRHAESCHEGGKSGTIGMIDVLWAIAAFCGLSDPQQ